MIAKKYRFNLRIKENQSIFLKNKKHSSLFSIYFNKNNLGYMRVNVVVSKKISKKAVQRNRIKRQLFALIEKILDVCKKDLDLIIIIRKESTFTKYHEELLKIFKAKSIL